MAALVAQLQSTTPHFIHCIKSNCVERPGLFHYETATRRVQK